MKFVKGMILGGAVTAGIAMAYLDTIGNSKKKLIKKGKKFMRKMGF